MICYVNDDGSPQWHVPVFNIIQAQSAFAHCQPEVHVWGMRPPLTNLLLSYQEAVEFFKDE